MRRSMVTVVVVGVVSLAGCTSEQPGQAQPVEGASSAPDDGLPHSGAPGVRDPLDVSRFVRNPCAALTPDQATNTLGLDPKGEYYGEFEKSIGPACSWNDRAKGSSAMVLFATNAVFDQGLSQLYAVRDRFEVFEPDKPIQGYPALVWMDRDQRSTGQCSLSVGVTDRLAVQMSATVSRDKRGKLDPCEGARTVADLAITTMKSGA